MATDDDELFDAWMTSDKHRGFRVFVKDGVIDRGLWESAPVKILFLLKESNEKEEVGGVKDLREDVRGMRAEGSAPKDQMWRKLSQWAFGILKMRETGKIPPFPDYSDSGTNPDLGLALCSTAVVNLKKSDGTNVSDCADLAGYVTADWSLLDRQINCAINPDLVVCGSTLSLIRPKLGKIEQVSDRIYKAQGRYFADFWHPSNHGSHAMNYYALCGLVSSSGILAERR